MRLAVAACFCLAGLASGQDFVEPLRLTRIEADIKVEPGANRFTVRAGLTLRNQSEAPLAELGFDLLSNEAKLALRTDIARVRRQTGESWREANFSRGGDPGLTRVSLLPPLAPGATLVLSFEYSVTHLDPGNPDLNYRVVASLPGGAKEYLLLEDYAWLPLPASDSAKRRDLFRRNLFPRDSLPSWTLTLRHPPRMAAIVINGRRDSSAVEEGEAVSEWTSVTGGLPQALIADGALREVRDGRRAAVFAVPPQGWNEEAVDALGRFLLRARASYESWFGAPPAKDVHVALSSTEQTGHGGYLGMFLHVSKVAQAPAPDAAYFDNTAAHELSHTWWGDWVVSYGRGTRLLREALATWSAARLTAVFQGRDAMADLKGRIGVRYGLMKPLFEPDRDDLSLAYSKGAMVVDALREEAGEEAFFRALRDFTSRHGGGHATYSDFSAAFVRAAGPAIARSFDKWCWEPGLPRVSGEAEARRLMLSSRATTSGEMYLRGVVMAESGDLEGAGRTLSEAMEAAARRSSFKVPMPFYFLSRGVVRLKARDAAAARADFAAFFDGLLSLEPKLPKHADELAGLFWGGGVLRENSRQGLAELIQLAAGEPVPLDMHLEALAAWWKAHKETYAIPASAGKIAPAGLAFVPAGW